MSRQTLWTRFSPQMQKPTFWLVPALVLLSVGGIVVTFIFCYQILKHGCVDDKDVHLAVGSTIIATGMVFMWRASCLAPALTCDADRFARCRCGLAYALFLCGLLNMTAFVALEQAEMLGALFPRADRLSEGVGLLSWWTYEKPWCNPMAGRLMLATGLACFGTLFFLYRSISNMEFKVRMNHPDAQPFSATEFWAGTWFRIGEAILFTVVIALLLYSYRGEQGELPVSEHLLPFVALFIGMFVKSAERLMEGMSVRVFAMVKALVPMESPATPEPKSDDKNS